MKLSEKRRKIIKILKKGHLLTAAEICQKATDIDRATVYRSLDFFVRNNLIRKVFIKEGIASFEIVKEGDNHQHFICNDCEKVVPIEIKVSEIKPLVPIGSQLEDFELNIRGKCEECY